MSEMLASALSFWGPAIASASLAALLIVPAAWAIETVWKSMPSLWRSWMWRLVFVKVIAVAVFPYAIELPVLPADEVTHSNSAGSTVVAAESDGTFAGTQGVVAPTEARPAPWWRISRVFPLLFGLWAFGVGANVVVALLGRSRAQKSRQHTTYVVTGPAFSTLDALFHRFGLRKRPDLIATSHEGSPFVADWVRPALYCPSVWLSSCSINEMRLAFAHELAHLARGDLAWNRFVAACQAILFFHPIVWLAAWRYRTAQEIACDEMALARTGGSPCDLARLLVGFVEQDSARLYGAAAMTGASVTIRERVLAMQRMIGSKSPGTWATALAVIAAILVLTPWTLAQEKAKVKRKKKIQTTQQANGQPTEGSSASASASTTTGGSASGSVSGGGSGSITVTGPGAGNSQESNSQQSTGSSQKVDVSESSSTTTTNGQTKTTINRTVLVVDDDREIKIVEDNDEIRVSITNRKTGEAKHYIAKSVKELKTKYEEAYSAYIESMPKKPGKNGATAAIKEKALKPGKAKPAAASKLMERHIEAMLQDPEIKGTSMEKMIRTMRRRMVKEKAAKDAQADNDDADDSDVDGADDEDSDDEAASAEAESIDEEEALDEEEVEEETSSIGVTKTIGNVSF